MTTRTIQDIDRTLTVIARAGRDDPRANARIDELLDERNRLSRLTWIERREDEVVLHIEPDLSGFTRNGEEK